MALLEKLDLTGGEEENSSSITETWICEYSDISGGYSSSLPQIGDAWSSNNRYKLTSVKFNREAKRYYSSTNASHNGADVVTIEFTYSINFTAKTDVYSEKLAGSGYREFKMSGNNARWYIPPTTEGGSFDYVPCGLNDTDYIYKLPITQLDLNTTFVGEINNYAYEQYRNKVNSIEFYGRAKGTVLFESYTITPTFVDGVVTETNLTLTFKCLPQDWNLEWKNPVPVYAKGSTTPLYWQNENKTIQSYTGYIQGGDKLVGTPVFNGSTATYDKLTGETISGTPAYVRTTETIGNPKLGKYGWTYRYWLTNPSLADTEQNRTYLYSYMDLNNLLEVDPTPTPPVPPTNPTDDDTEETENA